MDNDSKKETAVLGGGCFWCTEAVFQMLAGVISVVPGYAGGRTENPTYEAICGGATGHAEVIRITYNPKKISFRDLLAVFFGSHDPTTKNRQGNDTGPQYRSVIFYATPEQKAEAEQFVAQINDSHPSGAPVVTEIEPLAAFYAAENYHRDYFAKNPGNPYCEIVINPKLAKVKQKFAELLNKDSSPRIFDKKIIT